MSVSIEAMVLLRDWPLVRVMWFANFLTNIMAWGPMPPVVENDSVIVFGHLLLLVGSIHLSRGLVNTVGRSSGV